MPSAQLYDTLGATYTVTRRTEPRIAARIWAALGDARTVLNVGAGTGSYEPPDRHVLAVEPSALMRSQRRPDAAPCLAASAEHLPFADNSFDAVVSVLTHTDFDDPEAAFVEAARVLRRGGRLSYVGTHPCFVTPFMQRHPTGAHLLHPGYRQRGWHHAGPGFGQGIRPRVGVHHLPLADLIGLALGTGLMLTRLEEPGEEDYPFLIALQLQR